MNSQIKLDLTRKQKIKLKLENQSKNLKFHNKRFPKFKWITKRNM